MNVIQIRRDALADWTDANPILAAGEFALVIGDPDLRVGDGSTTFTDLPNLLAITDEAELSTANW